MGSTEAAAMAAQAMSTSPRSPMVWRRVFPGVPEQARQAREFVRFLLDGFPDADDVVQAAAELVANAVTHTRSGGPGGSYMLEIRRWPTGSSLALTDQGGSQEPSPGTDGELREHGYGLLTVRHLATWWGWHGTTRGRTVTAVFHRDGP
jgi:serine/threonine-protein kinase RsbW